MEITGNGPPPPDFIDFEITTGTKKTVLLSPIGIPYKYVTEISESDFVTPSGSECSDLSSLDDDVEYVEKAASSKTSLKKESSASSKQQESKTSSVREKPKTLYKFDARNDEEKKKKKKHKRRHNSSSRRWAGVQYSSDSEYSSEEQDIKPKSKPIPSLAKPMKIEEPEEDIKPQLAVTGAFGDYHCAVCDVTVNSELTLQTHLAGKKHRKELKAREIANLAMQGVANMEGVPVVPSESNPKNRRVLENEISYIQAVAEDYNKGPIPALSYVVEIRTKEKKHSTYYCSVCEATCTPITVMTHLIGFKHYMNSLKLIDPQSYSDYAYCPKKSIEHKVIRKLEHHERLHGRGLIVVEKEEEEVPPCSSSSYLDQPGPSWRVDGIKREFAAPASEGAAMDYSGISSKEDLSDLYNDFYCTVCDAHMNNKNMWESHVRGKRHLKNKRKPKDNISTKSYEDPNATAHLMQQLNVEDGPIVGLDYIKETQGELGDQYNCFLCGSCTSSYDIIEHLLTSKHRIKFLEAADKRGQTNGIASIKGMYEVGGYFKDNLIEAECRKHLDLYGSGKIKVYKAKELLETERRRY